MLSPPEFLPRIGHPGDRIPLASVHSRRIRECCGSSQGSTTWLAGHPGSCENEGDAEAAAVDTREHGKEWREREQGEKQVGGQRENGGVFLWINVRTPSCLLCLPVPAAQEELALSVTTEQGKTLADARGDVFRGLGQ